jgi:hypothetical protein
MSSSKDKGDRFPEEYERVVKKLPQEVEDFVAFKHLSLNMEAGIKMAILDEILERLSSGYREKLLSTISELVVEQLIMGNWTHII